jgi:Domain of unknown function (DUF4439)
MTAVTALSALQTALGAEDAAIFGYGVAGAHLVGSNQSAAAQDWTGHNEARDTLAAMISALGAVPVAAQASYQLPFPVHDTASAMALAAYLEDGVTRAYLGVVAVSDVRLRNFGALAMQGSAQRAAYWRGNTQAFPGLEASGSLCRTSSLLAAQGGEHAYDRGSGPVDVLGNGDPLRPGPPEPPTAILTAANVYVLLKRPRGRVHHVQARDPPWRRHQPRLKPPIGQLISQLFQIGSLHLVEFAGPFSFHRYPHCNH